MKNSILLRTLITITASIQPIHASIISIENQEDYNKIVQSNTPAIIVFSSESCPACTTLKKPLQKVSDNPDFKHITFASVEANKNQELAQQHKIEHTPTLHFMLGNEQKYEMVGAPQEEILTAEIKKIFGTDKQPVAAPAATSPAVTVTPTFTAEPIAETTVVEEHPAEPTAAQPEQEASQYSFVGIIEGFFNGIIYAFAALKNFIMDGITMIKNLFTSK